MAESVETAQEAFAAMLSTVIAPAMRAHNYVRTRTTFRRRSELGDITIVELQKSRGSGDHLVRFYVNYAIVPEPWRLWLNFDAPNRPGTKPGGLPTEVDGMLRERLRNRAVLGGQDWQVTNADDASTVGAAVLGAIEEQALPVLDEYLDRDRLRAALRDPTREFPLLDRELALATLSVAEGQTPELRAELDALLADDPGYKRFARWAWAEAKAYSTR